MVNRRKKTEMSNRVNQSMPEMRLRLIEQFGGHCKMCQSIQNLEFAHRIPTLLHGGVRGRKERYYDVQKNPNSYMLLCKKHHKEYDNGSILHSL